MGLQVCIHTEYTTRADYMGLQVCISAEATCKLLRVLEEARHARHRLSSIRETGIRDKHASIQQEGR